MLCCWSFIIKQLKIQFPIGPHYFSTVDQLIQISFVDVYLKTCTIQARYKGSI